LKDFYGDVLLLGVDCFRNNRPEDVDVPLLGPDGTLDARMIRVGELKGNIRVHAEADETFPRLKSQQRGVLQQLFGLKDPLIQEALAEPANIGFIKNVLGLSELVVPGEDSRNKQLREIQQLLASAPILVEVPMHPHTAATMAPGDLLHAQGAPVAPPVAPPLRAASGDAQNGATSEMSSAPDRGSRVTDHGSRNADHALHTLVLPSVPVDQLLDNHAVEFEECKRWANSQAGQAAHMTNPAGFANVRAHAEAHLRAMSIAAAPLSQQQQSPPQPGAGG
ncbi:MAG TPA: hypothetical protein VKF79_06505, partial [Candidatus Acidoferrum sp.]|nr:hypothetical protein [Candidatus Acidoferrum sp.]